MKKVINHGGICFVIIKMNNQNYLIKGEDLIKFIDKNTRKSIPYEYLKEKGFVIKESYNPALDYLKIVDEVYLERM